MGGKRNRVYIGIYIGNACIYYIHAILKQMVSSVSKGLKTEGISRKKARLFYYTQ